MLASSDNLLTERQLTAFKAKAISSDALIASVRTFFPGEYGSFAPSFGFNKTEFGGTPIEHGEPFKFPAARAGLLGVKPSAKLVKLMTYYYWVDRRVDLIGLNPLHETPNIFITSNPEVVTFGAASAAAQKAASAAEASAPGTGRAAYETTMDTQQVNLGAEFVKESVEKIQKLCPSSASASVAENSIAYIILGRREVGENIAAYTERLDLEFRESAEGVSIQQGAFDVGGASVQVYYLNFAGAKEKYATSQDIDILYELVQAGLYEHKPLVVHCQQGLDRAGLIALAIELYRNYDRFFLDASASDIPRNIACAIEAIRLSRSPEALTKPDDIQQAIALAHVFKSIDLVRQARQQLDDYMSKDKKGNPRIHSNKADVGRILAAVDAAETLAEKAKAINTGIATNPDLNKQKTVSFLQKGRGDTETVKRLKVLKAAFENQADLEDTLQMALNEGRIYAPAKKI